MLTGLAWLALEVKYLEPARSFYEETLGMAVRADAGDDPPGTGSGTEVRLAAGPTDLVLRRPIGPPRGGVHTHFAFSIPAAEYDDWWDRLSVDHDLDEVAFGSATSLYLYDPDGNCVELGQRDVDGPGIDGVFEVVLEVADLDRAESLYADLGFDAVDRGDDRRRVRLNGPTALELWEPQLGIADARGGVHVDLGFETADLEAVSDAIGDRACSLERTTVDGTDALAVRERDGHHLTFVES